MVSVIVAGSGFGGIFSALELDKRGYDVKLIDKNDFHIFKPDTVFLPGGKVDIEELKLDIRGFLPDSIEFVQEKITDIDPGGRRVVTDDSFYDYDKLVLGLGGETASYGLDISSVYSIYDLDDLLELSGLVDLVSRVIVVGSGYSGVELASELDLLGIDVVVVDGSEVPMKGSNDKSSGLAFEYLRNSDIVFMGGRRVVDLFENGLQLRDGEFLESDLVVWAGGLQASRVVQSSFDVGPSGLPVDSDFSAVDFDDVFAVGDNADHGFLKTGQNARKQGKLVGYNLGRAKSDRKFFDGGSIPLLISLGKMGIFEYGDFAFKSRFVRLVKDRVRDVYWVRLKSSRSGLSFF